MSSPITLPARPVDAAPANPHVHRGLYTAATVLDEARLFGGIRVRQTNCVVAGTWPAACRDTDEAVDKDGRREADRDDVLTTVVYAAYRCQPMGLNPGELEALASQAMRLKEAGEVEAELAPLLLAEAGTPGVAVRMARAVGAIEQQLRHTGMTGVIHASSAMAAVAAQASLVVAGPAGALMTPLGTSWAFGAGYDELEDVLVGTGPVTVRHDSIDALKAHEANVRGDRLVVAERTVSVGWECITVAQRVALEPVA